MVTMGQAVVRGALDTSLIRRIVRLHFNEVRFCYSKELQSTPGLQGRVVVQFVISEQGAVTTAVISQSTLGSPAVEQCVAQAAKRWTFPMPRGGGIVVVNYPFTFQPPKTAGIRPSLRSARADAPSGIILTSHTPSARPAISQSVVLGRPTVRGGAPAEWALKAARGHLDELKRFYSM